MKKKLDFWFLKENMILLIKLIINFIPIYEKWFWSWARKKYGHVEIATKDGFYYGKFVDVPGWSAKSWFTGYAYYYVWDNSQANIW